MSKGIFQMPLKLLINWFLLNHQVDYVIGYMDNGLHEDFSISNYKWVI